jgi:hypothetical protein
VRPGPAARAAVGGGDRARPRQAGAGRARRDGPAVIPGRVGEELPLLHPGRGPGLDVAGHLRVRAHRPDRRHRPPHRHGRPPGLLAEAAGVCAHVGPPALRATSPGKRGRAGPSSSSRPGWAAGCGTPA